MLWERGNNCEKPEQTRSSSGDLLDGKYISLQNGRDVAASNSYWCGSQKCCKKLETFVCKQECAQKASLRNCTVLFLPSLVGSAIWPSLEGEACRGFAEKPYSVCECFNWQTYLPLECRVHFDEGWDF